MTSERVIRTSSEAWKLLSGCLALYKPVGQTHRQLFRNVKAKLVQELNEMDLREKAEDLQLDGGGNFAHTFPVSSSELMPIRPLTKMSLKRTLRSINRAAYEDYRRHPLVLGPGFEQDDLRLRPVNPLTDRQSGVMLCTLNHRNLWKRLLSSARMAVTFRIRVELGRATDTGFVDGKTVVKSRNPYVKEKNLARVLALIQSSHQRQAFFHSKVSRQSQEAYELAVKGPTRPLEMDSDHSFVCGLKLVSPFGSKTDEIELELTCIKPNEQFLLKFISELGWKLKIHCVCSEMRCIRVGFATLDYALLEKHAGLENVLNNIYALQTLVDDNRDIVTGSAVNLKEPYAEEKIRD